jgi:hypothetical protein
MVFATWLTLRGDLAPPTLLWGNDTLGATTKDSGHHASDGNGEEDLANEFHTGLLLWSGAQPERPWR